MKTTFFAMLSGIFCIISCSPKLLNPLEGSHNFIAEPKGDGNIDGKAIVFKPDKNLQVRAIEKCKIIFAVSTEDSATLILAKGKFYTGYAYFKKCYVRKGDVVKRGQIIGELFPYDSNFDNSLSLSIRKMEKNTSIVAVENQFKNK
jgi:hypothetical protein